MNPKTSQTPLWSDILLLLACIGISYFKPVPFPWKVPLIAAMIVFYYWTAQHNLQCIGFRRIRWSALLLWGTGAAVLVVVGVSNLLSPAIEHLLNEPVDTSAYGPLEGNTPYVLDYWWKAMLSAAIAEELFYRGLCFYIGERLLGSGRWQKVVIVIGFSCYFAISHSFQGPSGVVGIGVASCIFGSTYYLSGRNIWTVILAHALVDSWSLFSLHQGGIRLFF